MASAPPPPNFSDIAAAVKSASPEQLAAIEAMLADKTGMTGRTMGASIALDDESDPATAARKLSEDARSAFASRLIASSEALATECKEEKLNEHATPRAVLSAFSQCPHGLSIPRGLIAKFLEKLPHLRPDEMKRVELDGADEFALHAATLRVIHGQFSPTWSASYSEDLMMHFKENRDDWFASADELNTWGYVVASVGAEACRQMFVANKKKGSLALPALKQVAVSASFALTCRPSSSRPHLDIIWCATQRNHDFEEAARHARLAIAKADAEGDNFVSCVARFELASTIMFGGFGDTFQLGAIQSIHKEATALEKSLFLINLDQYAREQCTGDTAVESFLLQAGKRFQPSKRFPKLKVNSAPDSGPELALKICDGCGKLFPKTLRCAKCKCAAYCSGKCQAADWAHHKKVCKPIVREINAKWFLQ